MGRMILIGIVILAISSPFWVFLYKYLSYKFFNIEKSTNKTDFELKKLREKEAEKYATKTKTKTKKSDNGIAEK